MSPYISKTEREELDGAIERLGIFADSPGKLNYSITQVLRKFEELEGTSYDTYNTVIGILECAKLEFYRRAISTYEDIKINENGDIYGN